MRKITINIITLLLLSLCNAHQTIAQNNSDTTEIIKIVMSEYSHASNLSIIKLPNFCLWERGGRKSYRWESQLSKHPLCPPNGMLKEVMLVSFEEHYYDGEQEHNHFKEYYISVDQNLVALWYKWFEPGAHDAEWRLFKCDEVEWVAQIKQIAYGK